MKREEATECIPNAVCNGTTGLQCTCNAGFYDDNFSTSGGFCVAGTYYSDVENCVVF